LAERWRALAPLVGCRIPHRTPIPCRRFPAACWPLANRASEQPRLPALRSRACCFISRRPSSFLPQAAIQHCQKRCLQGSQQVNGNVAPGVPSPVLLHVKWCCYSVAAILQHCAPPWRHGAWRALRVPPSRHAPSPGHIVAAAGRRTDDSDARLRPRGQFCPVTQHQKSKD
jgi:hypothetical protein